MDEVEDERKRRSWVTATLFVVAWLLVAILCLDDFGPTWDTALGDHVQGERVATFLANPAAFGFAAERAEPQPRKEPHPAFHDDLPWSHVCVPAATLSAYSCRLFWDWLGWLPAMSAHLLVVPALVALLAWVLIRFGERELGTGAGIAAALVLLAMPRFVTDALHNLKDAPETCCYAFAVLMCGSALRHGGLPRWFLAGVLAGVAIAQKLNGLFVPLQLAAFVAFASLVKPWRMQWRWSLPGTLVAGVGCFAGILAANPFYWVDPLRRLGSHFEAVAAIGNERLVSSALGMQAHAATVSLEAPWLVLVTTPAAILLLALVGSLAPLRTRGMRAFLLLWWIVPILRTSLPGMRNFDGVRHFLEYVVPLALLAGHGAMTLLRGVTKLGGRKRWPALVAGLALAAEPVSAVVRTYPFGHCYFSDLVGGLAGVRAHGSPDETDYWAGSYWQLLQWLDQNAESEALVFAPVANHVLTAAAPVRLRRDLRLGGPDQLTGSHSLYAIYVTREGFYPRWLREVDRTRRPVFSLAVSGATVAKVLRFRLTEDAQDLELWRRQIRSDADSIRLLKQLSSRPSDDLVKFWKILAGMAGSGEVAHRAMVELFPDEDQETLRTLLWAHGKD